MYIAHQKERLFIFKEEEESGRAVVMTRCFFLSCKQVYSSRFFSLIRCICIVVGYYTIIVLLILGDFLPGCCNTSHIIFLHIACIYI